MPTGGATATDAGGRGKKRGSAAAAASAEPGGGKDMTSAGAAATAEAAAAAAAAEAAEFRRLNVVLEPPGLQEKIDALPEDLLRLAVSSFLFDDREKPTLNRKLPKLLELDISDVAFRKIVLTQDTTPQLQGLKLHNAAPEDCHMEVSCPELRKVTLYHYESDVNPNAMNTMLAAATKLEMFASHKLWGGTTSLHFASPVLHTITLHRADSLDHLSIWAPSLTALDLSGCFSLDCIQFPKTHPLAVASPPKTKKAKQSLCVTIANANLGDAAMQALKKHPRARIVGDSDDDDDDDDF